MVETRLSSSCFVLNRIQHHSDIQHATALAKQRFCSLTLVKECHCRSLKVLESDWLTRVVPILFGRRPKNIRRVCRCVLKNRRNRWRQATSRDQTKCLTLAYTQRCSPVIQLSSPVWRSVYIRSYEAAIDHKTFFHFAECRPSTRPSSLVSACIRPGSWYRRSRVPIPMLRS